MSNKKLQVLIADDEYYICELLKNIINWDGLNIELIGFVHNGKELLSEVETKRPDIVITDICMPGMDGIELIKQVRCKDIPCQFIIVSGYRQFEYAHNALRYNVDDYILKPVDSNELNDALYKLIISIQSNGKATINIKNGTDNIKKFFLMHGIWEVEHKNVNLQDIMHDYSISFSQGLFLILQIKLDVVNKTTETVDDWGTLQIKLTSLFNKLFTEHCYQILTYRENSYIYFGINYASQNTELINNCINKYYELSRNILDIFIDSKITIGVGNAYNDVNLLAQSYREAQHAIHYRIKVGIDRIIYWNKVSTPAKNITSEQKNSILIRLKKSFEILDLSDFTECIKDLFSTSKSNFDVIEVIHIIQDITDLFVDVASSLQSNYSYDDYIKRQIYYSIQNAISIKELETSVTEPIVSIMKKLQEDIESQRIKPVRIAMSYIEQNYSKQIKLDDVASIVGYSPVYFSNIFKKETGETFIDYLSKYRMEVAKDLLRKSDKNINEIAELIGYKDPRYFSKLFKKIVGIKPTDFKKIYN